MGRGLKTVNEKQSTDTAKNDVTINGKIYDDKKRTDPTLHISCMSARRNIASAIFYFNFCDCFLRLNEQQRENEAQCAHMQRER